MVAFVSAYGGGTLRDLLLGVRPLTWINDNLAFALVFAGTAVTF
ncbi:TRIC cation channel family protein [Niabella sp. W65]|nr:TRIC cation channel family protein [Niabella sp. W65]MCH7368303.1 TRIC cation channel family protein [Niabella sp. W65]